MQKFYHFLITICIALSTTLIADEYYTEKLYPDWKQAFLIKEKLLEEQTDEQDLLIFLNPTFGKVLALDGIIQTTERDEFVYHEMIAHVPLLAHGSAKNVLIIGGGDGGVLREVLRHETIEKVTLVEIDHAVIEFAIEHFPNHSQGAFLDPRVEIVIQDGSHFVKETNLQFDVIICDCPDPTGPAVVLFSDEFFGDCQRILTKNGIFVNQNGVPFLQSEEFITTYRKLKNHFGNVDFYLAVIPTYVGGFMSFGFASNQSYRDISLSRLLEREKQIHGPLQYYSPEIHKAAFVLPRFMENLLHPIPTLLPARIN